ncbi:hypothetical protein BDR04DRAFT_1227685 [Suillus decipiens]|nr:hypothetical protein BDR04DRAFT_1227685 [Suillus decipiens]
MNASHAGEQEEHIILFEVTYFPIPVPIHLASFIVAAIREQVSAGHLTGLMGRRRGKLLSSTDPDYESRIQAALVDVTNGTCKNISVAARVARQTLRDRSRSLHVSRSDHAKSRQLLQPSEEDAVKDWLKKAENDVRLSRIEEDIDTKVFDGPLSSYKRKDDLITIAGALSLSRDGTVIDLTARIKEHLAGNPDCASQPRFAGLLGGK